MILYHAVNSYQLLVFILHKKIYYPHTPAYILISHGIIEKYPNYTDMLADFSDVLLCDLHIKLSAGESFQIGTKKYYD